MCLYISNEYFNCIIDVNTKLPETLSLKYIYCRSEERYTSLIALLKYLITSDKQTAVFAGTHHHVELISFVCTTHH